MGVCYTLFKENPHKQAFDLDKGAWWRILEYGNTQGNSFNLTVLFDNKTHLSNFIQDRIYYGGLGDCDHEGKYDCKICKPYFDELSKRLFVWCGKERVEMLSDNDDEYYERYKSYPITEDRFTPRLFNRD